MHSPANDVPALTPSMLRCLLAILKLSRESKPVASRSIAEMLCVKPPTVCRTLDSLLQLDLIRKEPYGKVELTEIGCQTAIEQEDLVEQLQQVVTCQLGLDSEESLRTALYFATSATRQTQMAMISHMAAETKRGRTYDATEFSRTG